MNDEKKFRMAGIVSTAVVVLVLAYAMIQEHLMPDVENYLQRKSYFESVLSKKGLSLHKGMYWKEKP